MKKNIKLLVLVGLICLSVVGCGSSDNNDTVTDDGLQQDVTEDDKNEGETASDDETTANETTENETTDENIAIKSQELFSYNGLTVTMKDVTYEKLLNEGIEVIVENTSNEKYTIQCDGADYNDYTYGASFYKTVGAGETIESQLITYGASEFFEKDEIAQVSLYFNVKDSTLNDVYDSGEILLKTSKADEIQMEKPEGGDVIYEGDNIRVTSLGLVRDESQGWHIELFVENDRGELINLDCDKALVNGNEIETLYYQDVSPNKMGLSTLTFYSAMSSYEFEDIEDIVISFQILNLDTWELIDNSDIISVPVKMAE